MENKYINISGKFWNTSDTNGCAIDAAQVALAGSNIETKLGDIDSKIKELEVSGGSGNANKIYESQLLMEADLENRTLGEVLVCNMGSNNYEMFIVSLDPSGTKIAKSTNENIVLPELIIQSIRVNDGNQLSATDLIECNKGDKIKISFTLDSQGNEDILATVQYKLGTLKSGDICKIYPGNDYEWTFDVPDTNSGIYNLSIFANVNKTQSKKSIIRLQIGSLSLTSTFNENTVIKSNTKVEIPVSVDVANEQLEIKSYILFDDEMILDGGTGVKKGPFTFEIPEEKITEGIHKIQIYLKNKENTIGADSNILTFTIVVAEEGIVYVIPDNNIYSVAEGVLLNIPIRVIQLGKEKSTFQTTVDIYYNNELERTSRYKLPFGKYNMEILNLTYKNNDSGSDEEKYSKYTVKFTVESEDEGVLPAEKEIEVRITENNYNISPVTEGLLCWFDAKGKSNLSDDYDIWEDKSGKNVKATFNNFNWSTNGWQNIVDANGDSSTALVLNSGAYVELDMTPFKDEIDETGITISIDFETENILDSSAKVVSCLKEVPGTDTVIYYLRDAYGNYIRNEENSKPDTNIQYETKVDMTNDNIPNLSNNNIINFFRYAGGYCWVDGKTYPNDDWPTLGLKTSDGELPYEITESSDLNDRQINLNQGDVDRDEETGIIKYNNIEDKNKKEIIINGQKFPLYDSNKDEYFIRFTGKSSKDVTTHKGFYIDTEYAVISNNASPSDVEGKFHLNFSENTRTRIDLVITRSEGSPYYFPTMIGYTNGTISLMKTINETDSFVQENKIYLGGEAQYSTEANKTKINIINTGSSKIYSFRVYNRALYPNEILRNYASEIANPEIKKKTIDNNGILNSDTVIDLPQITFVGTDIVGGPGTSTINTFLQNLRKNEGISVSDLKEIKEPAFIKFTTNANDENAYWRVNSKITNEIDNTITTKENSEYIPVRLQFQGTSSMVYPIKNYKFKCYDGFTKNTESKIKYGNKVTFDLGNRISEQTFCLKVDYMDSSHCNNTGSANFISNYNQFITGKTPASELNSNIRTTIYGFPVLIYYQINPNDTERYFIGVGNLNLDKSCTTSFGLKNKVKDTDDVSHNFGNAYFIDDDFTNDILIRAEYDPEEINNLNATGNSFRLFKENKIVNGEIYTLNDEPTAVKYGDKYYIINKILKFNEDEEKCTLTDNYEIMLRNPKSGNIVGSLTETGTMRTLDGVEVEMVQCSEFKANSGKDGAGGFGNYSIESVANDIELRQPDDGDIKDINYAAYTKVIPAGTAISYKEFKNPYYYHMQRMIKWVSNSDKLDFTENVDYHFNKNYLMDYYLTILLLGGVDSLGKNLMVGTWGPENRLYETSVDAIDEFKIEYPIGSGRYVTPVVNRIIEGQDKDGKNKYIYKLAKNDDGLQLYYNPKCFDRWGKKFKNGYKTIEVTNTPGECIWYPTFYDIDTIGGLDNAGQLLYDVDIEIGDRLSDGTSVFNTADSHLWNRVKKYLGEESFSETTEENQNTYSGSSPLSERWNLLRSVINENNGKSLFSKENLVDTFYYSRQISKIPEKYYNQDCFIKYIYESPYPPLVAKEDGKRVTIDEDMSGGGIDLAVNPNEKESGVYLYCIHGSRYEQIKRWYSQRISYIDNMFSRGWESVSMRFNHSKFDANFNDQIDYRDLPALALKFPELYIYDAENEMLKTKSGAEILPIKFEFKTYQPGYVGVKWSNNAGGNTIYKARIRRNGTAELIGNVPSAGDSEVFIYGGSNIKEIGDMYKYNVKKVDFGGLPKLSKVILGSDKNTCVINELILGENRYLSELDLTNCTSLSSLNLKGCINLRTLKMNGSAIASVSLPVGGALETIEYSSKIAAIKLENFMNLSEVKLSKDGIGNLSSFEMINCPKILGEKKIDGTIIPNAKGWALLQQTNISRGLEKITVEAYGECNPKKIGSNDYFFLDNFYNKENMDIRGELYYNGTAIPTNYTYFEKSYPNLSVTYNKVTDVSNMFADYKNINLIGTIDIYNGKDSYGNSLYKKCKYWIDSEETIYPGKKTAIEKWHNEEIMNQYNKGSQYSETLDYYNPEGSSDYYRLLHVYDDEDLDLLRKEIKNNVQHFSKFTNIAGMFKNLDILDYLDPDTFNGINLSQLVANGADEVFSGCKNLRYFETPNDFVKCEKREKYKNIDSDKFISREDENFDELMSSGKIETIEYYYDPVDKTEVDEPIREHVLGLRRIGQHMFKDCKKVRVFIRNLSNTDKITIDDTAFEYTCFDPTKESQESSVTIERPVILFERKAEEVLKTTNSSTSEFNGTAVENEKIPNTNPTLYFELDSEGRKQINPSNNYYKLSGSWLREVYFDIVKIVIDDENLYDDYKLSYAENSNGQRILFNVIAMTEVAEKTFGITEGNYENKLNLLSVCCGALRNLKNIEKLQIKFPEYTNLDVNRPEFEPERSLAQIFTEKYYKLKEIGELIPENLTHLFIMECKYLKADSLSGFNKVRYFGFDNNLIAIGHRAFENNTSMQNIYWNKKTSSKPTSSYNLVSIGQYSFSNSGINAIAIPNSVVNIGEGCFDGCRLLTSVNFSTSITEIPERLFAGCDNLTYLQNFSDLIESFEKEAFYQCTSLNLIGSNGKIIFNETNDKKGFSYFKNIKTIGESAFNQVGGIIPGTTNGDGSLAILELTLPSTLKQIGKSAFKCELNAPIPNDRYTEIVWEKIGNSDFSNLVIESEAFYNIQTGITLTINDKEEFIPNAVFIPKIHYIGTDAFRAYQISDQPEFCLVENSESEIGHNWINHTKKIIFNFKKITDITTRHPKYPLQEMTARYLLSSNKENNAYLYKVTNLIGPLFIRKSIEEEENSTTYKIKEILSGAFDDINITGIYFDDDSELSLIEENVLTTGNSEDLATIANISEGGIINYDKIPESLEISTSNNLKGTSWYKNKNSDNFIILGKYLIGGGQTSEGILDLTNIDCSVIYDNSFEGRTDVTKVIFNDNITHIYRGAFRNSGLEYIGEDEFNLPKNIAVIKEEAFYGCKFEKLKFPRSIIELEKAFKEKNDAKNGVGVLRYVEFADGCKLKKSTPFNVQTELNTGISGVGSVNVTLNTLIIPNSMPWLIDPSNVSMLRPLSQLKDLYIGDFERDSDGFCIETDNIPLFLVSNDSSEKTYSNTGIPYINSEGKQLYNFKFADDIRRVLVENNIQGYENFMIETTKPKSLCPLGGFKGNIDISHIIRYTSQDFNDSNIPESALNFGGLNAEEILRILLCFKNNNSGELYNVYIRRSQNNKIDIYRNILLAMGINVIFKVSDDYVL